MNGAEVCEKCKGVLRKVSIMESGNAKYLTYSCQNCGHTKVKCTGLI